MEKLLELIFCHFIGDYFLQTDYLAANKGQDFYIMLAHCILYCAPFYLLFGCVYQLAYIFLVHLIVDTLKARYKMFGLATDQLLHLLAMLLYLV